MKTIGCRNRRALLELAAGSCVLALAPSAVPDVHAQEAWPTRPVRIVVPFAAGGTTDVLARAIGRGLGENWGQPGGIEKRGGVGSLHGTVIGVAVLALLSNGMNLLNVTPFVQTAIKGILLMAVVALQSRKKIGL